MDPLTILAALGPVAVDLGKSLINKYITPDTFKPANVDEYMKVKQLDLDMFKALNDAGGANPSYLWVEAIVRLMRPILAVAVVGTWAYLAISHQSDATVNNFAAAVGFYMFGDRTLFYTKQK